MVSVDASVAGGGEARSSRPVTALGIIAGRHPVPFLVVVGRSQWAAGDSTDTNLNVTYALSHCQVTSSGKESGRWLQHRLPGVQVNSLRSFMYRPHQRWTFVSDA